MKLAYFKDMCPNCNSTIGSDRLSAGLPCKRCLPDEILNTSLDKVCELLKGNLKGLQPLCYLNEEIKRYIDFFKTKTSFYPWSLQVMWTKRILLGRSFSLIAPTGVGKTTWGIVTSAFVKGKSYILLPTKLLVEQVYQRVSLITEKKVLPYLGKKSQKEAIFNGDFDILITTTNFLYKNFENIPKNFDFIFVDDVDSVLKSGRNIDKILKVVGFSDEEINLAMEIINLKIQLISLKNEELKEKFLRKLSYLEKKLEKLKKVKRRAVLVVSSATSYPKSRRVKLFRELLDFEVGKTSTNLRNVEDIAVFPYKTDEILEKGISFVKKYGKGAFVFISEEYGKDFVNKVVDSFNNAGIPAISYEDFHPDKFDLFRSGKIEVVVGIASYRNPLARGVDIPDAVRYAVFLGVPKLKFPLQFTLSPASLFSILLACREVLDKEKVNSYLPFLKRYLTLKEELLDNYPTIKKRLEEIKEYLESAFAKEEVIEKLRKSDTVFLKEENGKLYIIVGDSTGYIQASGRTSRMFAGGLTKGISFLIVDDMKAFNSLRKRISFFLEDIEFKVLDDENGKKVAEEKGLPLISYSDIDLIFKKVDEDRKRVKAILEGKVSVENRELVKPTLVIVESPHKAKTISSFFGTPVRRKMKSLDVYEINIGDRLLLITASKGHLFDLTIKDGVWGVIEESDFYLPVYGTIKHCLKCGSQTTEMVCQKCKRKPDIDKKETVDSLRDVAVEVDEVFIASDPDTEGEKIGWDTALNIKPFEKNIKRAEFHEISKRAFLEAIENWREIDINLVKAQIVRRVADRWVGFSLSQNLQKFYGKNWLSAGRVQTPVLGWVIERADKSKEKKLVIEVETDVGTFLFDAKEEVRKIDKLEVEIVAVENEVKNPLPPFNTGEMIKEASYKLNFSADKIMSLAQELFESGFITYHRTDSIRVSPVGMGVAKEYISEKFGSEYLHLRKWGEGGAHECIRPVRPMDIEDLKLSQSLGNFYLTEDHLNLYDLIFRRFMASQMREIEVEKVVLHLKTLPDTIEKDEERYGRILKDGWNLVLEPSFPRCEFDYSKDKHLTFHVLKWRKKEVPVIFPFTEGELVEMMRERKIGRPSTYAKIVKTLFDRKYVIKKGKFIYPTQLGREVYEYLSKKFSKYVSEDFTRYLEHLMDLVEEGKKDYQEIIKEIKEVLKFADLATEMVGE